MAETNSRKLQRVKGVGPHVALNLEARASVELRALPASFPEQQLPAIPGRWLEVDGLGWWAQRPTEVPRPYV